MAGKCKHTRTKDGEARGFVASVAQHADHENPAAHGHVTYTETCLDCGAERSVNSNQGFYELGPWGPDAETVRRIEAAKKAKQQRAEEEREDASMAASGIEVLGVEDDRVLCSLRDREQWIDLREIREWAYPPSRGHRGEPLEQPDPSLQLVYRAILRRAEEMALYA